MLNLFKQKSFFIMGVALMQSFHKLAERYIYHVVNHNANPPSYAWFPGFKIDDCGLICPPLGSIEPVLLVFIYFYVFGFFLKSIYLNNVWAYQLHSSRR